MQTTQKVESSSQGEGEGEKKKFDIDLVDSSSDDVVVSLPRRLKRGRAFIDVEAKEASSDHEGDDYKEFSHSLSYSHKDDPLDVAANSDEEQAHNNNLDFDDLSKDLVVFDRSIPPDPLWYLSHWKLTPKTEITLLRKAASYKASISGEKRVRAPYKPPRSNKKK